MRQVEANLNREVDAFSREMLGIFQRHQLKRQTTIDINSLSLEQAYQVQDRYVAARLSLGERVVGWKVGCTSKAIREQFGLAQPICARLLKPHVHEDDADFLVSDFINCAVEPEMVFHIGTDLLATMDDVALMNSIVAVSPGIELHNYRFWYGKPSSQIDCLQRHSCRPGGWTAASTIARHRSRSGKSRAFRQRRASGLGNRDRDHGRPFQFSAVADPAPCE